MLDRLRRPVAILGTTLLVLGVVSCRTTGPKVVEVDADGKEKGPEDNARKRTLGTVETVYAEAGFVLVRRSGLNVPQEGARLVTEGEGPPAQLVATHHRKGVFFSANIEDGTPRVGDLVRHLVAADSATPSEQLTLPDREEWLSRSLPGERPETAAADTAGNTGATGAAGGDAGSRPEDSALAGIESGPFGASYGPSSVLGDDPRGPAPPARPATPTAPATGADRLPPLQPPPGNDRLPPLQPPPGRDGLPPLQPPPGGGAGLPPLKPAPASERTDGAPGSTIPPFPTPDDGLPPLKPPPPGR